MKLAPKAPSVNAIETLLIGAIIRVIAEFPVSHGVLSQAGKEAPPKAEVA